jgi:Domain of unknown function (DUF4276)
VRQLCVFCEGSTEQGFCNQVLRPHLFPQHDGRIATILIAHSKHHGKVNRGGVPPKYESMRRDVMNTLKSRHGHGEFFTTMIDLYALPRDFPGKDTHNRNPDNPTPYVEALEEALSNDIADRRFIPHLQLHEYETLLFADPEAFRIAFENCDREIEQLRAIAESFPSVEHINDGRATSPSKRIINVIPRYKSLKASAGPDIAEYTGLSVIRAKCSHFNGWLTRLEGLWK